MSKYRYFKAYGQEVDLSVEGKVGCIKCHSEGRDKSNDNLMVYGLNSDGLHTGGHCFSCGYHIPDEKYMMENGQQQEQEWELVGSEFNEEVHKKIKENSGVASKGYRGIREDISKPFGVRYEYDGQGEVAKVYYPTTINYGISGYKVRSHPKTFAAVGEVGKNCEMFGQFKYKTAGNTLLIVGGEHDQLAAVQMLKDNDPNGKYPEVAVVSGTVGEGSLFKQLQTQYEFINQFKKIVLCLDQDSAGEEATEKCVKVLPRNKVYIMKLDHKDPNDCLKNGGDKAFINSFFKAKLYTPAGVYASNELYEAALESLETKVISLPDFMRVASGMLGGGLPKEEITVILAKTSIGKTSVVNEITRHIAMHEPDEVLGILSLEATYKKYSRNLLSSFLKVPLHRLSLEEKNGVLTKNKDLITKLYEKEDGTPRFYVCDDRGANIESIKEKILQMVQEFGVTILVLDPYSDLLSGMDISQQEELATWFKRIMKEYGVTPIIISHVRKGSNNSEDHITEDDAQGSSFLAKASGCTLALERNKQAEDPMERNSTYCYILKNREFSETGAASKFYYDIKTATLHDFDDYFSNKVS